MRVPDDGGFGDWWLVTDWLNRAVSPGSIEFPLTLVADRWEQQVSVDGVALPFVFVGNDQVGCARGSVERRQVSVIGTGWPYDGLALAALSLKDVSPMLPERS